VKYQWKFERMFNGTPFLVNGNPVVIEAYGANGTRDFYLYGNLGFTAGTEWRVQVRPIFANNVVGNYGTDYQCLKFRGTAAAMPTIEVEDEKLAEKNLDYPGVAPLIYPNPSHSGSFRIDWFNKDELETLVEVWDAQGRKVGSWKWTEVNGHQIDGGSWDSGVYQIRVSRGNTNQWLRWMKL
jgi:hypothetical protein